METESLGKPIAAGRTAEIFAWRDNQILKLYRDWCPRDWIEYEMKIGRIVENAGLAAPKIGELVEIGERRGITYERINGISMLATFQKNPLTILKLGRAFAELHAAMHTAAAPADLPSMHAGFAHSIRRAPNLPTVWRDAALRALENLPEGAALCHGDLHPENVLMSARGPVIIDWMTAIRGNPLADVARTLLLLSIGEPTSVVERIIIGIARQKFIADYRQRYFELRQRDDAQLAAWMPIIAAARLNENIPGEAPRLLKIVQRLAL